MPQALTEQRLLEVARGAGRNAHFYLAPRYTPGSPALVDIGTCCHVGAEEVEAHEWTLDGTYGSQLQAKAQAEGVVNIAYARWEKGAKVYRLDLLTGECFVEPRQLDHDEVERVKILQNKQCYVGLRTDETRELGVLIARAKLHRQDF